MTVKDYSVGRMLPREYLLSMTLYAAAVLPLIHSLKVPGKWTENWYADDSFCVADLPSLLTRLEELLHRDPDYDCHPEPSRLLVLLIFSGF